jgi:hypothetical protein
MWLDCYGQEEIADATGVVQATIHNWIIKNGQLSDFNTAPTSLQHFDVWNLHKLDDSAGGKIFGRMPAQVVENLLWL